MGAQPQLRVVLDTNVAISALLFEQGQLAWFRYSWQSQRIAPLLDKACTAELLRVLAYPKFSLSAHEIETLLATYLPYAQVVKHLGRPARSLPRCRDADDQMFLRLADQGDAEVLVTGDGALLELAGSVRFTIQTPGEFRRRFDSEPR